MPEPTVEAERSPRAVLEAFFAAYRIGIDRVVDLFADDATVICEGASHVPHVGVHHGQKAIRRYFVSQERTTRPLRLEVSAIVEQGAHGVALGHLEALVVATQKVNKGGFALHVGVEHGLISHYHVYENTYSVAAAFAPDVP
jgi:uncharacterized protein